MEMKGFLALEALLALIIAISIFAMIAPQGYESPYVKIYEYQLLNDAGELYAKGWDIDYISRLAGRRIEVDKGCLGSIVAKRTVYEGNGFKKISLSFCD